MKEPTYEELERRFINQIQKYKIIKLTGKKNFYLTALSVISQKRILRVWRKITDTPLPAKIEAYVLSNKQIEKFLDYAKQPKCEELCIKEWGFIVPFKDTDGLVLSIGDTKLICIRNPSYPLASINSVLVDATLEHELRHINGDATPERTMNVIMNGAKKSDI